MPPVLLGVALATGAVLAARLVRREWKRVNRELEAARSEPGSATLRRDPDSNVWRPR
jgi:hypothetical protein